MSNCHVIQDPKFQPAMKVVAAITNTNPASITTTTNHQFINGTIVRFYVPDADGMSQLHKKTGVITVTGPTTFTVPIDTTTYNPFAIPAIPAWYQNTCSLVVPIGEINSQCAAATHDTR